MSPDMDFVLSVFPDFGAPTGGLIPLNARFFPSRLARDRFHSGAAGGGDQYGEKRERARETLRNRILA